MRESSWCTSMKNDFAVSGIHASSRNYRGLPPPAETPRMAGIIAAA
jgi:hypothetical protein